MNDGGFILVVSRTPRESTWATSQQAWGGVECNEEGDSVAVANMEDGKIYLFDAALRALSPPIGVFDPVTFDDGAPGLPPPKMIVCLDLDLHLTTGVIMCTPWQ